MRRRIVVVLCAVVVVVADSGRPAAAAAPRFQMPFPCGQTWRVATRDGHGSKYEGGYYAIDMNHDRGSTWERGRPVIAGGPGTVITSKYSVDASGRGYGHYVEVSHREGWVTLYAHLESRAVTVGQRVRRGALLGRVGDSGAPGAVHLHHEQVRNGVVRPVRFDGQRITYSEVYNGNPYTSRNC